MFPNPMLQPVISQARASLALSYGNLTDKAAIECTRLTIADDETHRQTRQPQSSCRCVCACELQTVQAAAATGEWMAALNSLWLVASTRNRRSWKMVGSLENSSRSFRRSAAAPIEMNHYFYFEEKRLNAPHTFHVLVLVVRHYCKYEAPLLISDQQQQQKSTNGARSAEEICLRDKAEHTAFAVSVARLLSPF